MDLINPSLQSVKPDKLTYLAERSARANVFIAHVAFGPRTAIRSSELDTLINQVTVSHQAETRQGRELAWTQFNGTEADPCRWLDDEPAHWQLLLNPTNDRAQLRYTQVDLHLRTKSGRTVKAMVRMLKQALSSRTFMIPKGVCPRVDAAGMSGRWLPIAGHVVIGDDKATLYLTETSFDFEKALGKSYATDVKTNQLAKMNKRNRREQRKARLVLHARIEGDWTTAWGTNDGPIPMRNERWAFMHAWHFGRSIVTPLTHDGVFHRAVVGTLLHDSKSYASRRVKAAFDGNSPLSVGGLNALLADGDIPGHIYPMVRHLDGATLTGIRQLGQDKGLATATRHLTNMLILFTDPKQEVIRLGNDVFLCLDPITPHGHLNSDVQSVLNFDILNAINPETGLPALEDSLVKIISEMQAAIDAHDNVAIAKFLGAQHDLDEEELADLQAQFGLMDFATTFASLNCKLEDGEAFGVPEFVRLMVKMTGFIETAFMHVKRLRVRYPEGIGHSGYIAPDYSVLCHPDPAKDGRGFWFDQGVLGENEFSLAVTTSTGRALHEGRSVLSRRPNGTRKEAVTGACAVKTDFYAEALNSPFLFHSVRDIVVRPGNAADLGMRELLTRSKLEKLYADLTNPSDGVVYVPANVRTCSIMGWGDHDDIVCVYSGYLGAHIERYVLATYKNMPDADLITAGPRPNPTSKTGASMLEARLRLVSPTDRLMKYVNEQFGAESASIGMLANAGIVLNAMRLMGAVINTPIEASLQRTEDVIDILKTGVGDINPAAVTKQLTDMWAEVKAIGQVPLFVINRLPYDLANDEAHPIKGVQTPYDDQIDRMHGHVRTFMDGLRFAYVERHLKAERYAGFLRNHNGDYRNITWIRHGWDFILEMKAARDEFSEIIRLRISEELTAASDVLAAAREKDPKLAERMTNLFTEAATRQACRDADRTICARYSPAVLEEIAVALYNHVYDQDQARKTEVVIDENGKPVQQYRTVADGQLFQPAMGEAFRRAIVRLYPGTTVPVPPTPRPERGSVAPVAAVRNLRHVRVVNFALAKASADERKAWFAKAEAKTEVQVFVLDRKSDTAMKILHAVLPDLKQDLDAVLIHVPGEAIHYGWVHRDDVVRFSEIAGDQLQLLGRLGVTGRSVYLEVQA